jgi:CoA:oxalate CoA-transferase
MSCLLDGIRVLDLTNVLAGPFCCYQLAQLGADVIKVEEPGKGDLARQLGGDPGLNAQLMGTSFLAQNAGKRSITVNLKSSDGRHVFEKLVASADVVVENFRPGVMERLGLGYDALRAINPGIVYCAISGYGKSGPLAGNPAYDQIIQGLSGVMSVTGDATTAPLRVGYPICDTIGGLSAAFAVAAALYRRQATGAGEMIDVSMLEATLGTMGWTVSNWLMAGHEPQPMGNQNMTAAPSGTFATGDGLLNIAANKQDQFERLCDLIGRPDLRVDPRFREREARKRNRDALNPLIEDALSTRAAADWAELLNAHGIPAGPVLTVPQVLSHEQVTGRAFIHNFEDARVPTGKVGVVRAGFRLASGDPKPSSPPPELGADTDRLLGELGYDAAERTALRAAGAV